MKKGKKGNVLWYGITRVERPVDGGIRIDTIYKTAKGQLAVATRFARSFRIGRKGKSTRMGKPAVLVT